MSGSEHHPIALLVAGTLASASCTPLAAGAAVVGGASTIGGVVLTANHTACKDDPWDKDGCLATSLGLLLVLLGILVGAPGGAYLYFKQSVAGTGQRTGEAVVRHGDDQQNVDAESPRASARQHISALLVWSFGA